MSKKLHDGGNHEQARGQPEDLRHRLAPAQALLQLRDQIGHGHVDKAAGRHHHQVRQVLLPLADQHIAQHATHHGSQARQGVVEQRA